ncbi:MAG: hypothetical protein ACRC0G_04950 [Fusobacteriaceae bacterium]
MLEVGKEYWIFKTSSCYFDYNNYNDFNKSEGVVVCSYLKKAKIIKINIRSYTVEIDGERDNLRFSSFYNSEIKATVYCGEELDEYEIITDDEKLNKLALEEKNFRLFNGSREIHENDYKIRHYEKRAKEIEEKIKKLQYEKEQFENWIYNRERDTEQKIKNAEKAIEFFRENCVVKTQNK